MKVFAASLLHTDARGHHLEVGVELNRTGTVARYYLERNNERVFESLFDNVHTITRKAESFA